MKVQSIDRVFDILELLSRETDGLSLTTISNELELPTSTVFRLLSVLRDRNYAEKDEDTNRYRLGLGFIELTSGFLSSLELKTEAQPFLRKLSQMTGQVVFMAIEQDGEVVYIDRFGPFNNHRNYCIIGSRMPLHCTALGKTLLMEYEDDDIRKLYAGRELAPLTEHSITDVDKLVEEIRTQRNRGYSEEVEENTIGRSCVAAPIYDYRGTIIAAVSTSWDNPAPNLPDKEQSIRLVREAAREISLRMGWIGAMNG